MTLFTILCNLGYLIQYLKWISMCSDNSKRKIITNYQTIVWAFDLRNTVWKFVLFPYYCILNFEYHIFVMFYNFAMYISWNLRFFKIITPQITKTVSTHTNTIRSHFSSPSYILFFVFIIFLKKFINSPTTHTREFPKHLRLPLWDKASAEFYFAKSRELLSRPFPLSSDTTPIHGSCKNLSDNENNHFIHDNLGFEGRFENLSFADELPSRRQRFGYRDRTLTKSENMVRKTYDPRFRNEQNNLVGKHPNMPGFNFTGSQFIEASFAYYKTESLFDDGFDPRRHEKKSDTFRPRTFSYSDTVQDGNFPRRNGRSVRDRNRRRQSYNPRAYDSSSSDSDCISVGSVDLDWRRRRRLSRHSGSNNSIRSEMIKKSTNPFLKPNFSLKMMGRSPPPSNSILSGLSPTSVSRCQKRSSNSSSSDSSL